ncbi:hypothetical protein ABIB57_003620 [Devosia sp. UYZn731]|uniref:hypothetical protein n=1 Tax=Devosia sp. UYZn731 TaxID=3156345 RepID=UPI0033997FF7
MTILKSVLAAPFALVGGAIMLVGGSLVVVGGAFLAIAVGLVGDDHHLITITRKPKLFVRD